jgi:hypothetical protein
VVPVNQPLTAADLVPDRTVFVDDAGNPANHPAQLLRRLGGRRDRAGRNWPGQADFKF